MAATVQLVFVDGDNDKGQVSIRVDSLGAGNADADALKTATAALLLGSDGGHRYIGDDTTYGLKSPASSLFAQRGIKWRVYVKDVTTERVETFTLPTANLNGSFAVTAGGRVIVDPTSSAYTDFKTALEDTMRSSAGNAIVLQEIQSEID